MSLSTTATATPQRSFLSSRAALLIIALLAAMFVWLPMSPALAAPTVTLNPATVAKVVHDEVPFVTANITEFAPNAAIESVTTDGATTVFTAAPTTDANGAGQLIFDYSAAPLAVGTHEIVVTVGGVAASATLTVTQDATVINATLQADPAVAPLNSDSQYFVDLLGSNFVPGVAVTITNTQNDRVITLPGTEVKADGTFVLGYDAIGDPGTVTFTATQGERTATVAVTVTGEATPSFILLQSSVTLNAEGVAPVSLEGSNFVAGEPLAITIDGQAPSATPTVVQADGTFAFTGNVQFAGPGNVEVVVTQGATRLVRTLFVMAAPATEASITVDTETTSPTSGMPTTTFNLAGFPANSSYTLTVTGPINFGVADGMTLPNGSQSYFTTQEFPPGTYTVTAEAGGVTASTTFTIAQAGATPPAGGGAGDPGAPAAPGTPAAPAAPADNPNELAATGGTLNFGGLAAAGLLLAAGAGFAIRARRIALAQ